MYNEIVFCIQVLCIALFALLSLKKGQSALVAFISVQAILANLFVTKQITLLGLHATGCDAFTIGSVLGLNLLQEYYGKRAAQAAIWTSFILLIFYTIVSQLHLAYTPASVDTMHPFFAMILSAMPRITSASLVVYLVVQHIDAWLYGYFKQHWHTQHFVARNYASLMITQLLDTVLFSFLGLYGIVHNITHIILVSYAIKVLAIITITPLIALVRHKISTESA